MSTTHDHNHDFASANKTYFDESAHIYDENPMRLERARRCAEDILQAYPFDEDTTSVMEFACGTGLVSRGLAPYAKSIVGVDISQGMVDQFNKRVANQGIPPEEMRAVCVELKGEEGELDGAKFDVIVCVSAYHHFTSIEDVTRILAFFLKPGGALVVIDMKQGEAGGHEHSHSHAHEPHGQKHEHPPTPAEFFSSHAVDHIVPHKGGFSEDEIKNVFENAGLESFSFQTAFNAKKNGKDVVLFIAKGSKPSAL